ncbi:Abi family protein [Marinomonas sp. 2405UD66-6]|uniref:Abi family protein n=1 Tax=Marinomonas sp. 2405UD66-6 TaxID=3391834 RepID=UPI0039C98F2C
MDSIKSTLSLSRMSTFEREVAGSNVNALDLYRWNAQLSSALIYPFHIFEVSLRNAVSDALSNVHSPHWHTAQSFRRSLKRAKKGYCSLDDLEKVVRKHSKLSKVIPELKFVFWEKCFTSRFQRQIWEKHIFNTFPNHTSLNLSSTDLREYIRIQIGLVREVRNRVAHHEPILKFDIPILMQSLEQIIRLRCEDTSEWMMANQQVLTVYEARPI